MAFDLQTVLRVLLLSAPGPLSVADLQAVVARWHARRQAEAAQAREDGEPPAADGATEVPTLVTAAQWREAAAALEAGWRAAGEVLTVREGAQGFRLHLEPAQAEWVRCLRDEPPPQRLSASVLETLAVIAYRQPVTRPEIESIRGVSSEGAIQRLLDRGLIRVSGRADLPGRPMQFGTTREFLDFVGVRSLEELPASDVLSPRQIDAWLASGGQSRKVTDEQVGLPGLESAPPAAPPPS